MTTRTMMTATTTTWTGAAKKTKAMLWATLPTTMGKTSTPTRKMAIARVTPKEKVA